MSSYRKLRREFSKKLENILPEQWLRHTVNDLVGLVRAHHKENPLPEEIWVIYLSMHNAVGSINHVSPGDRFFATKEACQKYIDEMPGWIGMGDRSRYRPMRLVSLDVGEGS